MSDIGGFLVGTTRTLLTPVQPVSVPAPAPKANDAAATAPAGSRPAGNSAIQLDLPKTGRTAEGVEAAVRGKLEGVFGVFYKDPDKLREVTDRAMASLGDQLKAATESDVEGVQFRLGNLRTDFGSAARVDQTVIEVGLVRGGRVAAADTAVFGIDGAAAGLGRDEIARGLSAGSYSRRSPLADAPAAEDDQVRSLRAVLDRLRSGQEAISAFRRGDAAPFETIARQFFPDQTRLR